MPRPYSNDLRERIVRAVEGGLSCNAAARHFGVAISTAVKLLQRWKATQSIQPDQSGGRKKHILQAHESRIRELVNDQKDITIKELQERLSAEGIEAKYSTLGAFLLHLGLTRKKRLPTRASKTGTMSPKPEKNGEKPRQT